MKNKIFNLCLVILFLYPTFLGAQGIADKEKIYADANSLFSQGLLEKAEEEYKRLISIYPDYAPAYNNLGIIYISDDSNRIVEGIKSFLQAIRINPYYVDPYSNLGILCYRINQLDKAVIYLERAIKLDPDNEKHYFNLGWVYLLGIKDYEKAQENFEKTLSLDERHAEALYALGMAYVSLGEKMLVFEPITKLRMINREDLATALENIIRTPYDEDSDVASEIASIKDKHKAKLAARQKVNTEYEITGIGSQSGPIESGGRMKGTASIQLKLNMSGDPNAPAVKQKVIEVR